MTLKEMVYNAILYNERVAAYKIFDEYWYVVIWNKQTYIHYTTKESGSNLKFHWYLSASTLCPKWKAQTEIIEVRGLVITDDSANMENYLEEQFEKSLRENPGCDLY